MGYALCPYGESPSKDWIKRTQKHPAMSRSWSLPGADERSFSGWNDEWFAFFDNQHRANLRVLLTYFDGVDAA